MFDNPRAEHLQWCKDRANEYLEKNDIQNGVASMLSNMDKHKETRGVNKIVALLGIMAVENHDIDAAKRFVNGFN